MTSTATTSRWVEQSPHLRLHTTRGGGKLAYHALFGNLAWLDEPLFGYLSAKAGPLQHEELQSEVGRDVARVLWNSYFFVASPDEERELIAGWLAERASKLETGFYLGGLQISSSNACNFACSYCFADAADRRSGVRQKVASASPNISFELAAKAIEQVRAVARSHGRNRIGVKFLGREPLINWKVMRRLLAVYPDRDVFWSVTTNGSLLTAEVARDLRRYNVRVMVSLDGPPTVNNQLRTLKVADAGPTYELIESALRSLSAAGHPFGVSTVISRATDFSVMHGFIDRVRGFGADEIELTLVMQTDPLRAQARYAEEEGFAEQLIDLYEYASGQGLLVHGDWVDPFHRILSTHKFRDEGRVVRPLGAGCQATEHQISVEPTGDLFPCRAMSLHYGHMDDFATALRGDGYRRVVMRTYYNVPYCRGCELEGHCQGTCLGSSEEASGDIYDPQEEYCAVYRTAARRLLERVAPERHTRRRLMISDLDPQRRLMHRLNGQLLKRLNQLLKEQLGTPWILENWIINVILLHRLVDQAYTAHLETSATYHKAILFDTDEKAFDPSRVAVLGLPVPLDRSFSGYSITTSDVVWIDNFEDLDIKSDHTLARLYRSFRYVGVSTPTDHPRAEYVFPLLIQIGLNHIVLGVLNMEYFVPQNAIPSPFEKKQLTITEVVTKLLNTHGPFLLTAQRPEMGAVLADDSSESRAVADDLLRIHKTVLDKHDLRSAEG